MTSLRTSAWEAKGSEVYFVSVMTKLILNGDLKIQIYGKWFKTSHVPFTFRSLVDLVCSKLERIEIIQSMRWFSMLSSMRSFLKQ